MAVAGFCSAEGHIRQTFSKLNRAKAWENHDLSCVASNAIGFFLSSRQEHAHSHDLHHMAVSHALCMVRLEIDRFPKKTEQNLENMVQETWQAQSGGTGMT